LEKNKSSFKKRKLDSSSGEQTPFKIKLKIIFGSALGVMEVRAFCGRTEVGHATIEYAREMGRQEFEAGS
jgi:hypothetical protein